MESSETHIDPLPRAFYRVSEVARVLSIGRSHAYKLVAEGHIPSVRIAGTNTLRVSAKALSQWIEGQEETPEIPKRT